MSLNSHNPFQCVREVPKVGLEPTVLLFIAPMTYQETPSTQTLVYSGIFTPRQCHNPFVEHPRPSLPAVLRLTLYIDFPPRPLTLLLSSPRITYKYKPMLESFTTQTAQHSYYALYAAFGSVLLAPADAEEGFPR